MFDLTLKAKIEEIMAQRPRKMVRVSDVLAVIDEESGGCPFFKPTDKQYAENLAAAVQITGMAPADIKAAMLIKFGAYNGQIAKFRVEPGYFKWALNYKKVFKPQDLIILACSFGLGQKMARWLINGVNQKEWIESIRHFMGSQNIQIAYVIGDLDQLLVGAKGDRQLAFTRYNAGPRASKASGAFTTYGKPVAEKAEEFEKQLNPEKINVPIQ
ncbi:MAG TPA: hypothetical protein V6C86_24095 [Oculatellaceae cyanobacterium]